MGEAMHSRALLGIAVASVLAACALGDSEQTPSGSADSGTPNLVGDASSPCVGMACRQVDCAAQGRPPTTLSGIVYDPGGKTALYNVFVYTPAQAPDPILPGRPRCAPCEADATGHPLASDSTDAKGWFHMVGVPAGDNVPLVMQIGKWRRQVVVPHIDACTDNELLNPDLLRLPAKTTEGDMPLIALATGCDAVECFLQSVGIDVSEFTSPQGPGHVHVYGGRYAGMTMPNMGDAYRLWASPDTLASYDMVIAGCECAPYPRDTEGPAYDAMETYLASGGRFFATHYHYNWFSPPNGPAAFQSVATWNDGSEAPLTEGDFLVDTSFPRGAAFAEWLQATALTSEYGHVPLIDTRNSVGQVSTATRWIYDDLGQGAGYATKYMSFNTPPAAQPANQCGRAVFSDVHVSGTSTLPGAFPLECSARFDSHADNQQALEFLFFDLVSCVQDDSLGPSAPPTH